MDYWARVLVYGVSLAVSKIVAFSVVVGVRYTELRNVSLGPCASGGRLNLFGDLPGFCLEALVLLSPYQQSILRRSIMLFDFISSVVSPLRPFLDSVVD